MSFIQSASLTTNRKIITDCKVKEKIISNIVERFREISNIPFPPYDPYSLAECLGYKITFNKKHDIPEFDGCTLPFSKVIYLHDTNYYRKTFTLAHEIFEDTLNRRYIGFVEKDFNWAAAEFLMPSDEFTDQAKAYGFNLYHLYDIYNNCSPLAISMRLLNLGLIDTVVVQYNGNEQLYGCECYSPIQEFEIGKNYKIIFGEDDLPF
ncbi:ImmA/IrrE family metallo-endopeptidase [Deferribacter autotrophicus]|uniref:ImmA/IrrE family metallo-endopeptidase n=1 Tax=Deferribacter autotrophicus TaxID=500465 RepID=A0A5A8F257_9BACT|nr:ImmA/IrrE family metallo-endopeptidase [Deferribacter autotrophicus]KAA0257505.1 ImmA/IrrE family metallo-endopeptidase [Deferribacter autotrophicus]